MARIARTALLLSLLGFALGLGAQRMPAISAAEPPIVWNTDLKLRTALDQPTGLTWGGLPLRRGLLSLSRTKQVAIVLDRHVDPEQKVELSFDDVPLETAFKRIAQRVKIGVGQVGSVFYFGPEATAKKIRTLSVLARDAARKLPTPARLRLLQLRASRWDEGTPPGDLVAELAKQCNVKVVGAERIPYDLWIAGDLPPLNFADRLLLISVQFDLSFQFSDDGETVTLVDMPKDVEITHSYAIPSDPGQTATILKKVRDNLPDAKIESSPGKLVVHGLAEDQDFVDTLLSGKTARKVTVGEGKKVYTLSIVMPVGKLINQLGPKLGFNVKIDDAAIEAAGLSLKKEVRVDVKDASAEELLAAVLAPAGLTFDQQGRAITVHPKK